jgi:hypothetical protein
MLLAPFALTDRTVATPVRAARRIETVRSMSIPRWLIVWAILGPMSVICFPALRGGGFAGLTVPFWLMAAPLINVAWLTRERWHSYFKQIHSASAAKGKGKGISRRRRA